MHGGHRWLALLILRLLSTAGLAGGSQEIPLFDSRGPSFVSTAAADDGVHEEGNGVSQEDEPCQERERLESLHFVACGVNNLVNVAA